jgi:membrane protease subunit (stomatin/prohibitin family)
MTIWRAVCTNLACNVWLPDHQENANDDTTPQFCPECGSGVIDHCPRCGEELPWQNAKANVFHKCGQRLRFDPDSHTGTVTVVVDT